MASTTATRTSQADEDVAEDVDTAAVVRVPAGEVVARLAILKPNN